MDSLDWKDPAPADITKRVLDRVQPGSIILFHNAAKNTPAALPSVLEGVETVVGGDGHRSGLWGIDAKDAALFVKFFHKYLLLNRPFQTLTHRF